jgi:hypothetical protein
MIVGSRVKELRHAPERVWQALVDPAQLREWAPFDAEGNLDTVGVTVRLTHSRSARAAHYRNKSDASRRSQDPGVHLG